MAEEESEPDVDDESDGETTSASTRWWLTNDVVAIMLTSVLCLIVLLDITSNYTAPQMVIGAFVGGFSVAVVWLFGKGAAKLIFGGGR